MMDEINEEIYLSMEHAKKCLTTAWFLLEGDDYPCAVNRAYYCVFHSVRALIRKDSVDFKKHSAMIGYFRANYIKTGIFETRLSDIIGDLFEDRNDSDYNDYFCIDRETVEAKINNAAYFHNKICEYLNIASPV